MKIPQVVNRYNLYRKGTKLVGLTGEVELPAVTMVTDTLEGAEPEEIWMFRSLGSQKTWIFRSRS